MRWLLLSLFLLTAACTSAPVAVSLERVAPSRVDRAVGGPVEVFGVGLRPEVKLDFDRPGRSEVRAAFQAWLEGDGVRVDLADVVWVADGQLTAVVPGGVREGRYDVHVLTPQGSEAVLVSGLETVDCLVVRCELPDGGDGDAGAPQADGGGPDGNDVDAGQLDGGDAGQGPCTAFTYLDRDLDSFGAPGSGAVQCGPGRVPQAGDCNDVDPLTSPAGTEVCNGLDDDCDGLVDDGVCAPIVAPAWKRIGSAGTTWASAWSWRSGSVWVGGASEVRRLTSGGATAVVGDSCPGNIVAVWAAPSGRAQIGGGTNGVTRIAPHEVGAIGCGDTTQYSAEALGSLVGFPLSDGGVAVVGALRSGRLVRGEPDFGGSPGASNLPSGSRVYDLHGVDPRTLYAVGTTNAQMRAWRLGADGGWVDEQVQQLGLPAGVLRGVWVIDAERAVAVGDQGVALQRTASGWRRLPDAGTDDFTSVRAFGPGRVYAVSDQGRVQRWNGADWVVLYDGGAALNDVTGTAEDDLWAVGAGGSVVRWPEPP
jgi:hypothetical protein